MNIDGTFHLPSLKNRLSESPTDRIIFMKKVTTDAGNAVAVAVPFKDDTQVFASIFYPYTVGSVNPGEIPFDGDNAVAATGTGLVVVIAQASQID